MCSPRTPSRSLNTVLPPSTPQRRFSRSLVCCEESSTSLSSLQWYVLSRSPLQVPCPTQRPPCPPTAHTRPTRSSFITLGPTHRRFIKNCRSCGAQVQK